MRLLPTPQAAKELHLHRNTLHRYRREGLLKAGTHGVGKAPGVMQGSCTTWMLALSCFGRGRLTLRYVFSSLIAQGCTKPNRICKAM